MESINIKHPINGTWVDITQVTDGNKRSYYTDGKLERVVTINANDYVVSTKKSNVGKS